MQEKETVRIMTAIIINMKLKKRNNSKIEIQKSRNNI